MANLGFLSREASIIAHIPQKERKGDLPNVLQTVKGRAGIQACALSYCVVTASPRPVPRVNLDCSPVMLRLAFSGLPQALARAWGHNDDC